MSVGPPSCRFCEAPLRDTFVDLGASPLCESFLDAAALERMEPFYPLHARVCRECFLVQVGDFVSAEEIFGTEYAYFSSYSDTWVEHARRFVAAAIDRFGLDGSSSVVEVASNDGYLLQHFLEKGVPALGIEPAPNVARAAQARGIDTRVEFFGLESARALRDERGPADLIIGNNVLAHTPTLNDFVSGLGALLAPRGTVVMEFPHLFELIEGNQFDTIYHEHFSYFSLWSVTQVFERHGLVVYDVETLSTHGGSLRIFAGLADEWSDAVGPAVRQLHEREVASGVTSLSTYSGFGARVEATKRDLLAFLVDAKSRGASIVAYGAPGKGNTLLNYCGIRSDFVDFAVDRNPYKHGRYTPGTRIPIKHPDALLEARPDYVLILPWNLRDEITTQLSAVREWGGRFVVPIPSLEIIE